MFKFTGGLLLVVVAILISSSSNVDAWGEWGKSAEKVKLKDIDVLTLYHGRMTTGRRSAGVPQLHCIGGDAGCNAFVPQVVQCYNRGSDGYDIQWECKSDLDNAFRFGKVSVTCEGFDYPDDPYVLKGSCGLEYTLDLTMEGRAQRQGSHHNYYGGGDTGGHYHQQDSAYGWKSDLYSKKGTSNGYLTNLACLVVVALLVYAFYKTCIAPPSVRDYQRSNTNDDYPGPQGPRYRPPPPPGFRPGYGDSSSSFQGGSDSCSGSARAGSSSGSGAGGFWTGAATGGILGYLFGQRNNTAYQRPGYGFTSGPSTSSGYSSWGGSSGGGGGMYSGGGRSSSSSSSSGTRTASGFGGTTRR